MGSSPLARGLPRLLIDAAFKTGIIPARAGFTPGAARPHPGPQDHPRSRGVYRSKDVENGEYTGSSPLARGLRAGGRPRPLTRGIIPARAGFIPGPRRGPRSRADHPRSRGVYRTTGRSAIPNHGSSPLARGLLRQPLRQSDQPRIIPARAGFTPTSTCCASAAGDHPRSRGVYTSPRTSKGAASGSSPLARGLPHIPRVSGDAPGIIPARAGFTEEQGYRRRHPGDHPRSRGVYLAAMGWSQRALGSSPLARGLPGQVLPLHRRRRIIPARAGFTPHHKKGGEPERIIPARAGFTLTHGLAPATATDHPRSRGVYSPAASAGVSSSGSSPLARGLRLAQPPHEVGLGIIPARAGFTPSTPPSPP